MDQTTWISTSRQAAHSMSTCSPNTHIVCVPEVPNKASPPLGARSELQGARWPCCDYIQSFMAFMWLNSTASSHHRGMVKSWCLVECITHHQTRCLFQGCCQRPSISTGLQIQQDSMGAGGPLTSLERAQSTWSFLLYDGDLSRYHLVCPIIYTCTYMWNT